MTQIEQICAEIEHQLTICKKSVIESNKNGFPLNSSMHTGEEIAYTKILDFINSLPQEPARECIVKEGKLTPALASNFCASEYIIDVTLTQEEQEKLNLLPLGSHNIKLKILCE